MREPPILELIGIRAAYGRREAVRGVDLRMPRGAVVALLGPNGAGKTTLLNVINGQVAPTEGDIHLAGVHVAGASPDQLVRAGLSTVPAGCGTFPNLTVAENLRLAASTTKPAERLFELAYDRFPGLFDRRSHLAGALSGGEQRLLSLARALASDPALLLLDELSTGLATRIADQLYDTVAEIAAADGLSVLVAEQFAGSTLRIADHAVVMSDGRIVASGEPAQIGGSLAHVHLAGAA